MYREMNKAIIKANNWAAENGLTLSPSKTVAVLFTRKTKFTLPQSPLKIGNKIIPLSQEVKYLGVILDARLTWKSHIEYKIRQCTKYLFMIRGSVRPSWGPPQLMMRWIWTSVVRPKLAYASAIWSHSCEENYHTQFNRLQRLALLQQGSFRMKSPGAALEIIAETAPLQLYLEQESVKASLRLINYLDLNWSGLAVVGPQKGHVRYLRDKLEE
jgi:hypothetical protein